MCVYYLMEVSNRVGRSIFFFIFLFIFYLIRNRVGRSGRFFCFHSIFFTIYVPRFGKKKINNNANYLVCFVLYDPSLDQRIFEKRTRKHSQTENQTDWLVHL